MVPNALGCGGIRSRVLFFLGRSLDVYPFVWVWWGAPALFYFDPSQMDHCFLCNEVLFFAFSFEVLVRFGCEFEDGYVFGAV